MTNSKGETSGKALRFVDSDGHQMRLCVEIWSDYGRDPVWAHGPQVTTGHVAAALLANPEARMAVLEKMPEWERARSLASGWLHGFPGRFEMNHAAKSILYAPTAESGKDSSPSPVVVGAAPAQAHDPSAGDGAGDCEPAPVAEAPERVTADEAWILLTSIMAHQDTAEQRQRMRRFVHQQEQLEREVAELRKELKTTKQSLQTERAYKNGAQAKLSESERKLERSEFLLSKARPLCGFVGKLGRADR